jgi:hypothetical protein
MRFEIPIGNKKVVLDYGCKEPDFVSREEVKQYAEVGQLSKDLRKLNKKIRKNSKRFGQTEFYVRGLSDADAELLRRKGFKVTYRNKTLKNGDPVLVKDQLKITV